MAEGMAAELRAVGLAEEMEVVAVAVEREVVVMAVEVTADLRPCHLLLDVLDTRHDAGAHRASSATRRRAHGRRPVARAV